MAKITLNPARSKGLINRNIYGHFSEHLGHCIYEGLFVGKNSAIPNTNGIRNDVVEALRKIAVPVLRWPGGCFADEYHWEDGIGPLENRKRMVNTNWGGLVEDNSFGTHEFMDLCEQLGCAPYINVNVGSGTVREMAEWVEYVNSDGDSSTVQKRWANGRRAAWNVKYWGIGNENWGGGGNMRPEYYADEFRRYQTYCRAYGDNRPFRIACGPNSDDYRWTEVLMQRAAGFMDGLSLHYYTICGDSWQNKGDSLVFTQEEYDRTIFRALRMEELVSRHSAIMDRYDPEKRVGLIVDEWGAWYDVMPGTNPGFLYQQNTMRDAVLAAVTLNIFNRHCDRVVMANIAQMVNVLQAVILTDGERMLLTPTYHVFELYKAHQDAREVDCFVEADQLAVKDGALPRITASSSEKNGVVTVTAANLSTRDSAGLTIQGAPATEATARGLYGAMDAYNDFDRTALAIQPLSGCAVENGMVRVTLPPCCVAEITIRQCY